MNVQTTAPPRAREQGFQALTEEIGLTPKTINAPQEDPAVPVSQNIVDNPQTMLPEPPKSLTKGP
jgi:hypothetical protein